MKLLQILSSVLLKIRTWQIILKHHFSSNPLRSHWITMSRLPIWFLSDGRLPGFRIFYTVQPLRVSRLKRPCEPVLFGLSSLAVPIACKKWKSVSTQCIWSSMVQSGQEIQGDWPCISPVFPAGVRTEQDLYARLIDSVTKQVGQLCLQPPFHNLHHHQPITPYFLPLSPYRTKGKTRIRRCAEFCLHTKSCAGELKPIQSGNPHCFCFCPFFFKETFGDKITLKLDIYH